MLVVMLLMGITAIPLVGLSSSAAAILIVKGLSLCGSAAVVFTMLLFWLIPEVETIEKAAQKESVESPLRSALISTLVILPLVIVFYTFSLINGILLFVFAAVLAQTPDLTAGMRSSAGLLIANALGGLFAMGIYTLLIAVPEFLFMFFLVLMVSLVFAQKIFSNDPYAGLYSTAFTAILLLVGNSLGDTSASAAVSFFVRIVQIIMAATYIVTAFYILSWLFGRTKEHVPGEGASAETSLVSELGQ